MQRLISIIGAIFFSFASVFPGLFDLPKTPSGQKLDLENRFNLVWSDEFNGNSLDRTKWAYNWWEVERKGGFWHEDMVRVKDGNLIISTEYKSEPLENRYYDQWQGVIDFKEYRPGYYTGCIETRGLFEFSYGYYEVRCILPAATGMWSAFWMMNEGVFQVDNSGKDGTEVDIFESMYYKDHWWRAGDCVISGIYYDGYGENSKGDSIGKFYADNPYQKYNTYGLEWTPDEYIFYINGVESGRISTGGVSENPEYLILSCEVAGKNGIADSDRHGTGKISHTPEENWPAEFIVDYVRVYEHKQ